MELVEKLIFEKEKEKKLSKRRKDKYATNCKTIEKLAGGDLLPILKDVAQTRKLIDRIDASEYAAWTKADFRLLVKMLWKLVNGYDTKDQPKEVRYIKVGITRQEKKKNWNLISAEEFDSIMQVANTRDKAILSILYELAPRVSEVVAMKKSDVSFDRQGCRLNIPATKTDSRSLLVQNSTPHLAAWLKDHPLKKDESPLFVSEYHGKFKQMRPETVLKMIHTNSKKAGIKKRMYCHLFRHTALTNLAKTLTEQQLKIAAGWLNDSTQAATYVHLSGKDLDAALKKAMGQPIKSDEITNKFAPIICERCGKQNAHDAKACQYCLFFFDKEKVRKSDMEIQEKMKKMEMQIGEIKAQNMKLERTLVKLAVQKVKEKIKN